LSSGAVAHIKYPIVISDESFRRATGFRPEHAEYETLAAFRAASPPRGQLGARGSRDATPVRVVAPAAEPADGKANGSARNGPVTAEPAGAPPTSAGGLSIAGEKARD
jgi:hypothetical protein